MNLTGISHTKTQCTKILRMRIQCRTTQRVLWVTRTSGILGVPGRQVALAPPRLRLSNNLTTGYDTRHYRKYPALSVFNKTNRDDVLVLEGKWGVSDPVGEDTAQSKCSAA